MFAALVPRVIGQLLWISPSFVYNNNNNGNISFSIQLKLQLQISLLQGNLQLASLVLQEKTLTIVRKKEKKLRKIKTTKIKTDVIPDNNGNFSF